MGMHYEQQKCGYHQKLVFIIASSFQTDEFITYIKIDTLYPSIYIHINLNIKETTPYPILLE